MGVRAGAAEPRGAGDAEEDGAAQGRIPFQLRIGVTGHRKLPEGKDLIKAVNDAIDLAISRSGYSAADRHTPLKLTVVSALAEGADRIVAREVLDRNGSLVCVLPVAKTDLELYRADFESEESKQEFDDLHGRAQQVIAPREHISPEQRDAGYLWAGQEVARRSDVIIAIWDGQAPRGVGGTADLILWLRNRDNKMRPRRVLQESGPLRIIVHTSAGRPPYASVDEAPPYDVAANAAQSRLKRDWDGLEAFNRKHFDPADWQRWTKEMTEQLAPDEYRQWPRLNGLLTLIAPPLIRADQEAMAAQWWFRWSSYALFGFTALATILAALQAIVFTGTWALTVGELALIVASVMIVFLERGWKNNNKHWFVYRFLAERLRTAFYLLVAGRAPEVDFDVGGTMEQPAQNDWVQRAFTAILAGGDPGKGHITEDPETLSSLIRAHWMTGQLRYFERTSKKMMRRHHTVVGLLYGVLGVTIVAALLHSLRMWSLHSGATEALIMCAIGLPAVAGALSNVRSLREFSRHAFRYTRMADVIYTYLDEFGEEPTLHEIGLAAEKVGSLLTAETRDWLVEVSSHGIEPHV
jgi:hypothetical protein